MPPTVLDIVRAVRQRAAEAPENVYVWQDGCCNFSGTCTDGSRGCLIGQGILRVVPDAADKVDDDAHAGEALIALGMDDDGVEADWLMAVQLCQDSGKTWSAAIEYADKF